VQKIKRWQQLSMVAECAVSGAWPPGSARLRRRLQIATLAGAFAMTAAHGAAQPDGSPLLNTDGSLNVPAFRLPFSQYASPEAQLEQAGRLERLARLLQDPSAGPRQNEPEPDLLHKPWVEAQWRRYPVAMTNETLAGVAVQVFKPKEGVSHKNAHRVLINLHGGAFLQGWPFASQIESVPIASVGRIQVISINYRLAPKARFPAASEDVAAVYAALLKTYKPTQIGIYGCSAGGMLAGQAIAWFDKAKLPLPAAIGILSASTGGAFHGDSAYITPHLGGYFPVPDPSQESLHPYFKGVSGTDPLVAPDNSPTLLAKFPPTLIATGTRAGDMSAAVHSHMQLVKAGVDARLYLWDGLEHCFMYNPELPESREAYSLLTRFFDEEMDRRQR
jgi:epsilon-lactone hydrolase